MPAKPAKATKAKPTKVTKAKPQLLGGTALRAAAKAMAKAKPTKPPAAKAKPPAAKAKAKPTKRTVPAPKLIRPPIPPLPPRKPIVMTRGDRLVQFIERYCMVPEGMLVGQNMRLMDEQKNYLRDVYDNVDETGTLITRTAIFSTPRKNGKTGLIAPITLGHLIGPEAKLNSQIYSAARSREQAGVVFNYMAKSLRMNNKLEGLVHITDSGKRIVGLEANVAYRALSAEATTAHGLSPAMTIHDELGQVEGPQDALFDALETAGGAQLEPLTHIISTQAASDAALLSTLIDDALDNPTPSTVLHLYTTPNDDSVNIFDEQTWYISNFALGVFRSLKDMRDLARRAQRMPSFENAFRNLYLNQRVSAFSSFIAESVWKGIGAAPSAADELWYTQPVHLGLDLSRKRDLTAAVLAVRDPETGHVYMRLFAYTPREGIDARSREDKVPYSLWLRQGMLHAFDGHVVDYPMVAEHLKDSTDGMNLASISFDRWRIDDFKKAAEECDFASDGSVMWLPVGQGYKDMTPRIDLFEQLVMAGALHHFNNPVFNFAVNGAVVATDVQMNRKLEKSKSRSRIDPLIAGLMATYAAHNGIQPEGPKKKPVSESSLFFV